MAEADSIDPHARNVEHDLRESAFVDGVTNGKWEVVSHDFPTLIFRVRATEEDGSQSWYGFRANLDNFPAWNPKVSIWDIDANTPLNNAKRPRGNRRVQQAFKHWGKDTVYRAWDRETAAHSPASVKPSTQWRSDRHLSFVLEDIYAHLNLNARAHRAKATSQPSL